MDKKRLIAEGAVQQSKDEATIQVFCLFSMLGNQNVCVSLTGVKLFKFSVANLRFVHYIVLEL